jgi:YVTN family beta-propeller protein
MQYKFPNRRAPVAATRGFLFALLLLLLSLWAINSERPADAQQSAAFTIEGPAEGPLPGMPPVLDPHDIYAADRAGNFSPTVKDFPSRVYVPNSGDGTVDVIDPETYKIIDHFAVSQLPQHIVPSYDLKTLWVLDDYGNDVTRIDPATGKKGAKVAVADPYNLYFTPNGQYAVVVAEALQQLHFREPQTMKLEHSAAVPCKGPNHLDFSVDGRYFLLSCEFDGQVLKMDLATQKVIGSLTVNRGGQPQDVRLSPDGKVFYIADMKANGVHLIDGDQFKQIGFIPTGEGAHGLQFSRDAKLMYVSNRMEGSISVIDLAKRKVINKWEIPGGGSPDMGGLSADGRVLWITGRYSSTVYAMDMTNGKLLAKIPVGKGPHGLCVYPQPGRYSLGHTGAFR